MPSSANLADVFSDAVREHLVICYLQSGHDTCERTVADRIVAEAACL
jgi:hypothetical protein